MNLKKVALIELYTWHTECLDSQVSYLSKSKCELSLFCDIRQQKNVEHLRESASEIIFYDMKKFSSLLALRRHLIKGRFQNVILNTAQGSLTLKLMLLPFPKWMNIVGTIHNIKKLYSSFGQKLISHKIKKYYILADYLKSSFPKDKGLSCQPYVPVPISKETIFMPIDKPNGEKWLVIPGAITKVRRDYDFLLSVIQKKGFPSNIKFILLGNALNSDGSSFIAQVKALGLEHYFIYFNSFVSHELFCSYIKASDVLLPLIHSNTPELNNYLHYKISGTFTLCDVFGIRMFCYSAFKSIEEFNYPSSFYSNEEEFITLLNENIKEVETTEDKFEENRKQYMSLLS